MPKSRLALLKAVRRLVPEMPTHVFKELVLPVFDGYFYSVCCNKIWDLEVRSVTIDSFNDETQRRMRERDFGNKNPYDIENEFERMDWQRKNCIPGKNEPVVTTEDDDGRLCLHEGWHRTMALLTIKTPMDPIDIRMWVGKSVDNGAVHR